MIKLDLFLLGAAVYHVLRTKPAQTFQLYFFFYKIQVLRVCKTSVLIRIRRKNLGVGVGHNGQTAGKNDLGNYFKVLISTVRKTQTNANYCEPKRVSKTYRKTLLFLSVKIKTYQMTSIQ